VGSVVHASYFYIMRTYIIAYISAIVLTVFHCCANTPKKLPLQHLKQLGATKQAYGGGAAGSAPGIIYIISCQVLVSGEINNIKATISAEQLPVKIVYRNAEYSKLSLVAGDTLLFRIKKSTGATPGTRDRSALPERQLTSTNSSLTSNESAVIRYTINKRKELLQIKEFRETAPLIYQ
jgi:hypothetical protein